MSVLILALVSLNSRVLAQTSGSIYGTVTDDSGAVISGAVVVVTDLHTALSKRLKTDTSGDYQFPVLCPGDYEVYASAAEFQTQTQEPVRLDANQNVHVSFALKVGSPEQTMTVEAHTALVDTHESQLGETVDQIRLQDLPLNGRNAYDLLQVVPGVTNYMPDVATGSRVATQVTVNGASLNTGFYLDGAYNTDTQLGGNLLPNPDALQELRVLTGNFDAEFGHLGGAVVNAITKSGTSQFHALAFDYFRNDVLNAKNWFLTSVTPLRQNQFGGNAGGPVPITHEQDFFFVSYQGLRTRQPATVASSSLITPTILERKGDFRSTPTPFQPDVSCLGVQHLICPDLLDPVAQNLLEFVPVGDSSPGSSLGHPVQQVANANGNVDQAMVRADFRLREGHQVSGMYFQSRGTENNPTRTGNQILSYAGVQNYGGQYNGVLSEVWSISSSKVNSARIVYSLNHFVGVNIYGNQHMLPNLGSQAVMGSNYTAPPDFNILGYWQMGTNGGGPNNTASSTLGVSETLNWTFRGHEMKISGAYMRHRFSNTGAGASNGLFTFTGYFTGKALADFLEGKVDSLTQDNGVFQRGYSQDPSLFFQENWRANRRLTLNLGLRWEYYPPYIGQNNTGTFVAGVQSTRFPSAPRGLLTSGDRGIPDGVLRTPWNTFAPRIGFAYDLFGDGTTAIRGAYGIYYSPIQQQILNDLVQQPFSRSVTIAQAPSLVMPFSPAPDPFPYTPTPANAVFLSGASISGLPVGDAKIPSVQQFSLGVQQQYGPKWSSEIYYAGNVGRHLYSVLDENSPIYSTACTGATCGTTIGENARRPYQPMPAIYTFGAISIAAPAASSSYHSLQAVINRRFNRLFSLEANFVWSKLTGFGDPTNAYDLRSSLGLLDIDVPINFRASYILVVPGPRRLGSLGKVMLSGWEVSGITILRSGQPVNVTSGIDTNFDGNNNDRPNVVGNPHLPGGRSRVETKTAFFKPEAFSVPPPGTPYGNAPFDMLFGPKYVSTDLSAFKVLPVSKQAALQIRAEVFNAFNNVNMNAPDTTKKSPAFGMISGAGSPRIIQMVLRISY
ncbi:MAG TPA: carboxypeptidase regulatory-like domain-containing protein [Terracidiphilus sp.]|jgi:hypothetical protein